VRGPNENLNSNDNEGDLSYISFNLSQSELESRKQDLTPTGAYDAIPW